MGLGLGLVRVRVNMYVPGKRCRWGDNYVRAPRATGDPLRAIAPFVDYHPEAGLG